MKNWDEYFLEIAKTVSSRSNCIRAQVGAVIVDKNNTIKSTGYNGTPSKVLSCSELGFCYRQANNIPSGTRYETCRSIHAEQNAIIQAGMDKCKDATMYIWGHNFICILCKRFIVQSGIKNIVLQKDENSPVIKCTVEELIVELSQSVLKI
ncbi:MAG: dCMP deaminase family protein [Candidatus Gastranaerophilales bacterium]|nr:dCMP deaminase family protein [Candidatus Gastranaerophilales bacterium]